MASPRSLSNLAAVIQANAGLIESALKTSNSPPPSFALGSPPVLMISPDLEECRDDLVDALEELRALVLGPIGHLFTLMVPISSVTSTLHVLYRFKIAKNLPLQETLTYSELAKRCGLPEDDLRRFVQMAMTVRIFEEPEIGKVRHNAVSAAMVAIPQLNDFLGMMCEESGPAALKVVESLQKFPASQEPSESAAAIANGNRGDFFSVIGKDPERVQRFANAMSLGSSVPSHSCSHFVNHMDWDGESCPKTIVDIGGSQGELCKVLLDRFSGIEKATVLDLADVVAGIEVADVYKNRLAFDGYDFFTEQKIQGVDVYLFRNIFHDWPDKYAQKILRNQVPAMRAGSRVFVHETCLPDFASKSLTQNHILRTTDLMMKMSFNAKERSREDWCSLFAAADERFKVKSIHTPAHAAIAIIEVVWEG